jgi:hypothetical protein
MYGRWGVKEQQGERDMHGKAPAAPAKQPQQIATWGEGRGRGR